MVLDNGYISIDVGEIDINIIAMAVRELAELNGIDLGEKQI